MHPKYLQVRWSKTRMQFFWYGKPSLALSEFIIVIYKPLAVQIRFSLCRLCLLAEQKHKQNLKSRINISAFPSRSTHKQKSILLFYLRFLLTLEASFNSPVNKKPKRNWDICLDFSNLDCRKLRLGSELALCWDLTLQISGQHLFGFKMLWNLRRFWTAIFSSRFFLNVMTSFKDCQKCHSEPGVFPSTGVYVITQE